MAELCLISNIYKTVRQLSILFELFVPRKEQATVFTF